MPAPVSTGAMFKPNAVSTISSVTLVKAMVTTLLITEPSVRARLARSSASSDVPRLSSCSKRVTSRPVMRTSA